MSIDKALPIVISVIALLVSVFNSYFQFFYKSKKIMASILNCSPTSDGYLSMKIALSNPGNREAIFETATLVAPSRENLIRINEDPDASINNGYNNKLNTDSNFINQTAPNSELPRLLKPGEMFLTDIRASFDIKEYLQKNYLTDKNIKKIPVGISFKLIDYDGQEKNTFITACAEILINNNRIDMIRCMRKAIDICSHALKIVPPKY